MGFAGLTTPDALGFAAGTLTTIAFVPQLLRIMRTRSARDISWGMFSVFSVFSVGVVLWLWYSIEVSALPLIVANVATLALAVAILVLKWRYGRRPKPLHYGAEQEEEP